MVVAASHHQHEAGAQVHESAHNHHVQLAGQSSCTASRTVHMSEHWVGWVGSPCALSTPHQTDVGVRTPRPSSQSTAKSMDGGRKVPLDELLEAVGSKEAAEALEALVAWDVLPDRLATVLLAMVPLVWSKVAFAKACCRK